MKFNSESNWDVLYITYIIVKCGWQPFTMRIFKFSIDNKLCNVCIAYQRASGNSIELPFCIESCKEFYYCTLLALAIMDIKKFH